VLAVLIGTPVGILAGTYLAEYGRHDRLSSVVRFINDILLSAPSIVVGPVHLRDTGRPHGAFLRLCGRRRAGGHRHAGRHPHEPKTC